MLFFIHKIKGVEIIGITYFKLGLINGILCLIFYFIAASTLKDTYTYISLILGIMGILFASIAFYKEYKTDVFEEIKKKYKG